MLGGDLSVLRTAYKIKIFVPQENYGYSKYVLIHQSYLIKKKIIKVYIVTLA